MTARGLIIGRNWLADGSATSFGWSPFKFGRKEEPDMKNDRELLQQALSRALCGKDAHVQAIQALEDLDWKDAGAQPKGVPHTIFQLLHHMIYWQNWTIKWLDGEDPELPKHAVLSWPADPGPKNRSIWQKARDDFLTGLEHLMQRSDELKFLKRSGKWSHSDMMQIIASHNSYHLGQIVLIRRMLSSWPPPSGGDTW